MPRTQGLTEKQERFCNEYLRDFNATAAAKRAGYSTNSAASIGWENLIKPEIQKRLSELKEQARESAGVTPEMIVAELAKLAFFNSGAYIKLTSDGEPYIDMADMTPEQMAAVSSIQVDDYQDGRGEDARDVKRIKINTHCKLKAIDLLMKFFELGKESLDITSAGQPISNGEVLSDLVVWHNLAPRFRLVSISLNPFLGRFSKNVFNMGFQDRIVFANLVYCFRLELVARQRLTSTDIKARRTGGWSFWKAVKPYASLTSGVYSRAPMAAFG